MMSNVMEDLERKIISSYTHRSENQIKIACNSKLHSDIQNKNLKFREVSHDMVVLCAPFL